MSGFLFVLRKELLERRLVFPVALLLGVVPWLLPWLVPDERSADVRAAAAVALAVGVLLVLAWATGASTLVGDLAEGRLGFLFSQPISAGAIWTGKVAAALTVSLGAALLVLLPSAWTLAASLWAHPVSAALSMAGPAALLIVLASAVVALAVRARTAWLFLDLAAVGLAVGASLWGIRGLRALGASGAAALVLTALLPMVLLCWMLATSASIRIGRSETDRAHRASSLYAAGGLALVAALVAGYAGWAVRVEPDDLAGIDSSGALRGTTWVAVTGPLRARPGAWATILVDVASDRHTVVPADLEGGRRTQVALSGDGLVLAYALGSDRGEWEIAWVDLGVSEPAWTEVPVGLGCELATTRLSADGASLACWCLLGGGEGLLRVHETRTGRLVVEDRLDGPTPKEIRFRGTEELLLVGPSRTTPYESWLSVRRYSLSEGRVTAERGIGPVGGYWVDGVGETIGTSEGVYSVRTGEQLRSFDLDDSPVWTVPWRLSPGVFGGCGSIYRHDMGKAFWCRFWVDGEGESVHVPFHEQEVELHGQPARGQVLASTRAEDGWSTWLIDAASGEKSVVARGLRSIAPPWAPIGSPATGLYLDDRGGLVRLEPSGERTLLLRGRLDPDADFETWPFAYDLDWLVDPFVAVGSVGLPKPTARPG
jgi:hypothetical protein